MRLKLIFLLLINCFFFRGAAQEQLEEDPLPVTEEYGLRLGVDITKPARTLIEEDYRGFQIQGDYRLYEDIYLAAEIGNEENVISEANVTASVNGSYIKLGGNYNFYDNWTGMQNLIFVGLRYGFATFSSELLEYSIYTTNPYFDPDIRLEQQEFNNLTASWAELQLGIKVEVLNNVYLGTQVQLKRRISQQKPTNFDNLYIPGFNRTYDESTFGVGYGYSISYLIPFFRK